MYRSFFTLFLLSFLACSVAQEQHPEKTEADPTIPSSPPRIKVGAERTTFYLPLFENKNIALVVNQTSTIGSVHLADSLLSAGVSIKKIFAPEHGFRGIADAGEHVVDGIDKKTGIPIGSLYGKKKKPSEADLAGIDLIVFDVQDVGARFYTYISTMTYIMETCAEQQIPLVILDRPNPLGFYVDGPIMTEGYESFIGMHKVPIVHGMTIGEYAKMVNGEGWLSGGISCELSVVTCENYDHDSLYELPVKPSPNLPNMRSIYLYPSICLFEGTEASEGRGTENQFQVVGSPNFVETDFRFTPKSMPGAKYPKHENKVCFGFDFSNIPIDSLQARKQIDLKPILSFYNQFPEKDQFFLENLFFDKLAGGKELKEQIIAGMGEESIRASWQEGLQAFKETRKKYLLYKDFE